MVSGLGAGCAVAGRAAPQRRASLGGAIFVVLNSFDLIWGFILYDFWSPTEAERFKNAGRLSDFCFCYLLEFR